MNQRDEEINVEDKQYPVETFKKKKKAPSSPFWLGGIV